jgi:hypothetical protein
MEIMAILERSYFNEVVFKYTKKIKILNNLPKHDRVDKKSISRAISPLKEHSAEN